MKLFKMAVLIALSCFHLPAFSSFLKDGEYKAIFGNGNAYHIHLAATELGWQGIKGEEKGLSDEIRQFQHVNLRKGIDVYQWVGSKGNFNFNVIIIDREHATILASGVNKHESWMWQGHLIPWSA